jgi:hypothetical protein
MPDLVDVQCGSGLGALANVDMNATLSWLVASVLLLLRGRAAFFAFAAYYGGSGQACAAYAAPWITRRRLKRFCQ